MHERSVAANFVPHLVLESMLFVCMKAMLHYRQRHAVIVSKLLLLVIMQVLIVHTLYKYSPV